MLHREMNLLQTKTSLKLHINSNIQGKQLCYCCNGEDTKGGIGDITFYGTTRELYEQIKAINVFLDIEKLKFMQKINLKTLLKT